MVAALPEIYRAALQLTEYAGLTQQKLAERLRMFVSGAKSRVQRAPDASTHAARLLFAPLKRGEHA